MKLYALAMLIAVTAGKEDVKNEDKKPKKMHKEVTYDKETGIKTIKKTVDDYFEYAIKYKGDKKNEDMPECSLSSPCGDAYDKAETHCCMKVDIKKDGEYK